MKVGRKPIIRRAHYVKKYKLGPNHDKLRALFLDQLDACKDDHARRLLLGVNRDGTRKGL